MKKTLLFVAFIVTAGMIFFSGCQKEELYEEDKNQEENFSIYKDEPVYCGDPTVAIITDYEETINAGTVTIGNDETKLYVTFAAADNWNLLNFYLYVGPASDVPLGDGYVLDEVEKTGEFKQWLFPIQQGNAVNDLTRTYEFDLETLDECFIVVAYSNVKDLTNNEVYLGWSNFNSEYKSSGHYVDYCVQECNPVVPLGGPKLAFAHNLQYSECFKDIKRSSGKYYPQGTGTWKNFTLWGWRNGPFEPGTYTFDLWAGSQGCDPENGILVGEVTLDYNGNVATLTYNVLPEYNLKATQAYIGKKRLYKKWGHFHVLPILYPKKHFNVNSTTDTFTRNNLNGQDIYFTSSAFVEDAEQ